jgi:SAM-dependent methyltransferase
MSSYPKDYATDPARFAAAREATQRWSTHGDVHTDVAERFVREGLAPVLDIGCGDGALRAALPSDWPWVGVDDDLGLLGAAGRGGVRADATVCPVRTGSCSAAAALWMLYHLEQPRLAIAEARRALRSGGLFAACTTARSDSPELHPFFGPPEPTTFDAEEAVDIVADVFGAPNVEALRWDGPYTVLPDRDAIAIYLRGRGISEEGADEVAAAVDTPFAVTKRGVLVWARK